MGLAAAACQAKGLPVTPVNIRDNIRYVANPPGEKVYAGVDGLTKALSLLQQGKEINYEGVAGPVDFDKYGDVVTPIEIWKYTEKDPYIVTVRYETDIPLK